MVSSFEQCLAKVRKNAEWESVVEADNLELGACCTTERQVVELISEIERLQALDLDDDAGDVGDYVWRLCGSIADALVRAGTVATPALLKTLDESEEEVALYAARCLGRLAAEEAVPALARRLQRAASSHERCGYIIALGDIASDRIIAVLSPFLGPSEGARAARVVGYAARALARTRNPVVTEMLVQVLNNDREPLARRGAVDGLYDLHSDDALRALKAASESNAEVRGAIESAISRWEEPSSSL